MDKIIYAGTGHRPNKLGGYGVEAYQRLVNLAQNYLEDNRPDIVISGMAQGWDQALAEASINLKIATWGYIPCWNHEIKWPPEAVNHYRVLKSQLNKVEFIWKGYYNSFCMNRRNKKMVDDCTAVLALFNGDQTGGTCNTVAYAKQKQKPIINLWDRYKALYL